MTHPSPTTSFAIRIERPHGEIEELVATNERLLIGSGAHCDIRVGAEAAPEHVAIEHNAHGFEVRPIWLAEPAVVGGQPLQTPLQVQRETETEIAIGGTRILVTAVREKQKATSNRYLRLAKMAALGITTAMLLVVAIAGAQMAPPRRTAPPPAVTLWDTEPSSCKEAPAQQAAAARKALLNARAKRERHPFAVEDGVVAVDIYATAARCFDDAGMALLAESTRKEALALKTVIERDYFVHRVRLEHALETEDLYGAITELKILRRMTSAATGPYVQWLASAERQLEASVRDAEQKASSKGMFGI